MFPLWPRPTPSHQEHSYVNTQHTYTHSKHTVLRRSPLISQHIKMGPLNMLALEGFTHWAFLFFFKIFFFMQTIYKLSSVQSLSRVQLFATPWTAARHASLSITDSRQLLRLVSVELVMPSNDLILCHPLLLLSSIFPSQFFISGGQSIGASASVLPVNIQD